MKIAIVSSGSSIHVKKIANELVKRGHDLTLYTMQNHMKLIDDFDKRIKIVKLPVKAPFGYYINALVLRKMLKSENYDLINSHYASGYGTLVRLANVHPLSLAVFGSDVFEYPFQSRFNMNSVIKNLDFADVITSTSNVMADKVKEFYCRKKPIYVTPFGVDLKHFHPIYVEKDDVFEIGIVKKIEMKYGIEFLLQAFKILREEYGITKSRLVIYGRGTALEQYQEMARELSIDEHVYFKGFIQNELVPGVLSHMDVACFPSVEDSESFGVAAVEAMACGVPVIASDASGFTEVVESGVTGYIVPKKDSRAIADAIYKVYAMPVTERKKMGQAGIERVKKYYDFNDNMNEYEAAIRRAVKE